VASQTAGTDVTAGVVPEPLVAAAAEVTAVVVVVMAVKNVLQVIEILVNGPTVRIMSHNNNAVIIMDIMVAVIKVIEVSKKPYHLLRQRSTK